MTSRHEAEQEIKDTRNEVKHDATKEKHDSDRRDQRDGRDNANVENKQYEKDPTKTKQ